MCPSANDPGYEGLLQGAAAPWAKDRAKLLAAAGLEGSRSLYDSSLKRQQEHDSLLDICASAFGPESRAYRETDFAFLSAEPLKEKGVRSFDCLIYSTKKRYALFVECKSSVSAGGDVLADTRRAIADEQANRPYLEDQIGGPIEIAEYVLCVPSPSYQETFHAIQRLETAGAVPSDPPILLWSIDKFSGQQLTLCTTLIWRKPPTGQHRDSGLTHLLSSALSVEESEMVTKVYPSSHPVRVGREILIQAWKRQKPQKAGRLELVASEVIDSLAQPSTMPHYAARQIAPSLLRTFLRDAVDYGIAEDPGETPGMVPLKVEGKQLLTILRAYERTHKEGWASRHARKSAEEAVVEEYYRRQTRLPIDGEDEPGPTAPPASAKPPG